jgi:hypothetical protein
MIHLPSKNWMKLCLFGIIGGVTPAQEGGAAPSALASKATTPTDAAPQEC